MRDTGVVLVAHGDRSGADPNAALLGHARALAAPGRFAHVGAGVLKGEPPLEEALRAAARAAPRVVVVPLMMAEGYFTTRVLPQRLADAGVVARATPPVGLHPAIPSLIGTLAHERAADAGFAPAASTLLIVGHGSAIGERARVPVERAVRALSGAGFGDVRAAYVEEEPFLGPAIADLDRPTVIASLLASDGLHGADDVEAALEGVRVPVVRTGALGRDARLRPLLLDLIEGRSGA